MHTNKYKLLKLTWLVKKAHQEFLNENVIHYDLSPNEGIILLFLYKHDLDTAKEIAEYRSISKSLVSKSITNLLERGLIEIRIDALDKRIKRLELTQKADVIIEALNQDEISFYKQLETGLNKEDKKVLDRISDILYDNVSKMLDQ